MLLERILVVLAGGAFGGFVLWDALNALRLAWLARRWAYAPGVVTWAELRLRGVMRSGGGLWEVQVAYDYWVWGRHYEGRRLCFTSRPVSGEIWQRAAALRDQYARGTRVAVRYDPHRPDRAVLEPRVDWLSVSANAVMGAIPLVAVGWALLDLAGLANF